MMNTAEYFKIPPDLIRGPEADALPLSGEVNWGMAAFLVDRLRGASNSGEGIIAGIVDTGAGPHPELSNMIASRDFTGSPSGANDRNGHGTHTTGTVGSTNPQIGMANNCQLVHGKGLSDGGSGSGQWIANAMMFCAQNGATIISMSLGSPSEDSYITGAMRELAQQGIWVVCAAGNSGPNTGNVDWPGRSPYCISVAALGPDLNPASFSSAGDKIDTSFAGVNIWSDKPGGGYQQMSGTSMATPGVAGVLTLYRAALKKKQQKIPAIDELRAKIFAQSTDTFTPGKDRRTGPGWISPVLLDLDLTADPPPVK